MKHNQLRPLHDSHFEGSNELPSLKSDPSYRKSVDYERSKRKGPVSQHALSMKGLKRDRSDLNVSNATEGNSILMSAKVRKGGVTPAIISQNTLANSNSNEGISL